MNSFALFTDVSVNPRRKLGVGAYLALPASFIEVSPHSIEISALVERLVVRRFNDTSSTQLEVRTVLWAMEDLKFTEPAKLRVYSDSQCVAGLLRRRNRLRASGFVSRGSNRLLKNASLYRKFYEFHDKLGFEVIKVAGHISASSHDTVHRIFSFVDRKVRKALNLWIDELD
jgi:ribonuclease HI